MSVAERKTLKVILAKYVEVDSEVGELQRTLEEINANREYNGFQVVDFKIVSKIDA